MKILPEMYHWTRKSPLSLRSHLEPDPEIFNGIFTINHNQSHLLAQVKPNIKYKKKQSICHVTNLSRTARLNKKHPQLP